MSKAVFLLLPTTVLIVLLWLPFGFHMGGLIEEWGLLALYVQRGPILFAGAHSMMPQHQIRPLMTTPWALAYLVDPNSWWPWHVELALSLLIKGASMSWLARYLTGSRKWSVVAGLLFVVWPADTMQMAFRGLGIDLSAGLAPLSAALFIAAYHSAPSAKRALLCLAGAACIVVGSWMYELTLVLAPLPFLVLYARDGLSSAFRRTVRCYRVTLSWLLTVTICVGYIVHALLTAKETYQEDVIGAHASHIAVLMANLPQLFTHGFVRSLADGWVDAARILAHDFPSRWYFLVLATVFSAITYLNGRSQASTERADTARLARVAVAGAVALAFGYAPFLLSAYHLSITQRTFLFAAIGSSLVFVAGLIAVERVSRAAALAAAVALLTLGTAQQLYQFREYTANYEQQRKVLRAIVEQAPDLSPSKMLVVLDASDSINHTWMLNITLQSALTYVYGHVIQVPKVCLTPLNEWEQRDADGVMGSCAETAEAWVFKSAPPLEHAGVPPRPPSPDVTVPKQDAVIVRINSDGTAPDTPEVRAARAELLRSSSTAGARYREALGPDTWPATLRFLDEPRLKPTYRWDFGHRWSLDHAEPGSGWEEGQWIYSPFRQVSVAWINQPRASLVFPLSPNNENYSLRIHLVNNDGIAPDKLSIKVNDVIVPIRWSLLTDVLADISAGILKRGMNMLEFDAPVSKTSHVSFQFDWIELGPAPSIPDK